MMPGVRSILLVTQEEIIHEQKPSKAALKTTILSVKKLTEELKYVEVVVSEVLKISLPLHPT
jgi:hypothetical protein